MSLYKVIVLVAQESSPCLYQDLITSRSLPALSVKWTDNQSFIRYLFSLFQQKTYRSECPIMQWQWGKCHGTFFIRSFFLWSLICNTCCKQSPTGVGRVCSRLCRDTAQLCNTWEMLCACTTVKSSFSIATKATPLNSVTASKANIIGWGCVFICRLQF